MFHILVVDDDKNTRKLIEAVLRRENFTVSTSENGKDALLETIPVDDSLARNERI